MVVVSRPFRHTSQKRVKMGGAALWGIVGPRESGSAQNGVQAVKKNFFQADYMWENMTKVGHET